MDNGSTSYPKAPGVGEAVKDYIENIGVNINRGGYTEAYDMEETVLDTRLMLNKLFGYHKPENVIFTSGVTMSLNILIKGFLKPGDHVITTTMEHNAVMRPLVQLEKTGVEISRAACNLDGSLDENNIVSLIKDNTKLVVMLHGSNVCGTILPVEKVAHICKERGIRLIVDCAQTGGLIPFDMEKWGVDAVAFAGHKSLLGPQGTGGFIISDDFIKEVDPVISGGTGSISHLEEVPDFLPDKYECGTMNLPGITGLNKALKYLEQEGTDNIRKHELNCTKALIEGFKTIKGIRITGTEDYKKRTAVVSVDFLYKDNAVIAYELESKYGIMTRCGLHCAPSAHKTLNTYPEGTVRFTPGYFTSMEDIEKTIEAVKAVLKE